MDNYELAKSIAGVYSILAEGAFIFVGTKMVNKLAPANGFLGKVRNFGVGYILAITVKSLVADKAAESCESTANMSVRMLEWLEEKFSN